MRAHVTASGRAIAAGIVPPYLFDIGVKITFLKARQASPSAF